MSLINEGKVALWFAKIYIFIIVGAIFVIIIFGIRALLTLEIGYKDLVRPG
jgi:hypothetical protein